MSAENSPYRAVTPADLLGKDEAPDAPRPTGPDRPSTAIGGVITGRVLSPPMEILSVPASEIQPFDGITEGTAVAHVHHHEAEQRDPLTGVVTRRRLVTVVSCGARLVGEDYDGHHVHRLLSEGVDESIFDPDEMVRVARPAPIASCADCGFAR